MWVNEKLKVQEVSLAAELGKVRILSGCPQISVPWNSSFRGAPEGLPFRGTVGVFIFTSHMLISFLFNFLVLSVSEEEEGQEDRGSLDSPAVPSRIFQTNEQKF